MMPNPARVTWHDRTGIAYADIHVTVTVTVMMLANALQLAIDYSELPYNDHGQRSDLEDLTDEQIRAVVEDVIARFGSTMQPEDRPNVDVITAVEKAFGYLR